jgi:hypothetical protein
MHINKKALGHRKTHNAKRLTTRRPNMAPRRHRATFVARSSSRKRNTRRQIRGGAKDDSFGPNIRVLQHQFSICGKIRDWGSLKEAVFANADAKRIIHEDPIR